MGLHHILTIDAMVYRAVLTRIVRVATVLKCFAQAKIIAAQMFSVTLIDVKDPFAHWIKNAKLIRASEAHAVIIKIVQPMNLHFLRNATVSDAHPGANAKEMSSATRHASKDIALSILAVQPQHYRQEIDVST